MKHIIIAGCSRTGKTTLSNLLINKGYIHYQMDLIKRAICKSFSLYENENWKSVSPKMADFISQIINDPLVETDTYKHCCIDTCHLYPKDISRERLNNTIVLFLGYPNIDKKNKLLEIRKHDKKGVWTFNKSDKELLNNIELAIRYSKEAKKQCESLGIPFFDTSFDFNKTIKDAYGYIESELYKGDDKNDELERRKKFGKENRYSI